ncbi:hypothetical protein MG293_011237 [Ovis ammon polii]|uniref:Uncharacterized protein n=1 Tax=Ovis ammon polii TaxID=230172 RepID=A0AAD4U8H1_OVIAM|nr:hypothetical protein MG293_011237 [Ovis ammon polii]
MSVGGQVVLTWITIVSSLNFSLGITLAPNDGGLTRFLELYENCPELRACEGNSRTDVRAIGLTDEREKGPGSAELQEKECFSEEVFYPGLSAIERMSTVGASYEPASCHSNRSHTGKSPGLKGLCQMQAIEFEEFCFSYKKSSERHWTPKAE